MVDPLDMEIAKAAKEVDEAVIGHQRALRAAEQWAAEVAIKRARFQALQQAAQLRPAFSEARTGAALHHRNAGQGSKGRQLGAISRAWRKILMVSASRYKNGATEEEIAVIGREIGLANLRPKDVRDRMIRYQEYGYVTSADNGRWIVSGEAVARFGALARGEDLDEQALEAEAAEASSETSAA